MVDVRKNITCQPNRAVFASKNDYLTHWKWAGDKFFMLNICEIVEKFELIHSNHDISCLNKWKSTKYRDTYFNSDILTRPTKTEWSWLSKMSMNINWTDGGNGACMSENCSMQGRTSFYNCFESLCDNCTNEDYSNFQ